jgi:hypothetical protein
MISQKIYNPSKLSSIAAQLLKSSLTAQTMSTSKSKSISYIVLEDQWKNTEAYLKRILPHCHTFNLKANGTSECEVHCKLFLAKFLCRLFFEKDIKGDLIRMMTNIRMISNVQHSSVLF